MVASGVVEGVGWLAADIIPNSLYRVTFLAFVFLFGFFFFFSLVGGL